MSVVHTEADALEALLWSFVEQHEKPALDTQIALSQSCMARLCREHDAALSQPGADLAAAVAEYTEQSLGLQEKRGEQYVIANLMRGIEETDDTPLRIQGKDLTHVSLELLSEERGDDAMQVDSVSQPDIPRMVEEFQSRKKLRSSLSTLQHERDAMQKEVARKRETASRLNDAIASIVKAASPLMDMGNATDISPKKSTEPVDILPSPLFVLFSQFSNAQTIYSADIKVQIAEGAIDELPSLPEWKPHVTVVIQQASGSQAKPCKCHFGYSAEMNTILAHCSTHPHVFDQVDCDDNGSAWLHKVNRVQFEHAAIPEIPDCGKPYRWTQRLAGLDLLSLYTDCSSGKQHSRSNWTVVKFISQIQQLLRTEE